MIYILLIKSVRDPLKSHFYVISTVCYVGTMAGNFETERVEVTLATPLERPDTDFLLK